MIHMQNTTEKLLIAPQQITNGEAEVTANFDTIGFDYATITVAVSTGVNTNAIGPTIKIYENDTTVATNFVTLQAGVVNVNSSANITRYLVDAKTGKRYLRIGVTCATTTNDLCYISVTGVSARKEQMPSNAAAMVATTNDTATLFTS
jgi:hypothetical protein